MTPPEKHIKVIKRRIGHLTERIVQHPSSFDKAERGALEWALANLDPLFTAPQADTRKAVEARPVGEIEHNQVDGFYMQALVPWDSMPVGTKLYAEPIDVRKVAEATREAAAKESNRWQQGYAGSAKSTATGAHIMAIDIDAVIESVRGKP